MPNGLSTRVAVTVLAVLASVPSPLLAQDPVANKRPLTHDDYDDWKSIGATDITHDGAWLAAAITAQEGDGYLLIRETTGDRSYRQPRGTGPRFTSDGLHVVFMIEPPKAEVKQRKLDQLKKQRAASEAAAAGAPAQAETPPAAGAGGGPAGGARGRRGGGPGAAQGAGPRGASGGGAGGDQSDDDAPKSQLAILRLSDGHVDLVARVKGFRVPEEGPALVAYQLEKEIEKRAAATPDAGAASRPATASEAEGSASRSRRGSAGSQATSQTGSRPASQPRDPAARRRQDGTPLVIKDFATGKDQRIEGVLSYELARKKPILLVHCSSKTDDPKVEHGLFALDLVTKQRTTLIAGVFEARGFAWDKEETRLAFYCNKDDWKAEKPVDDIYLWDLKAPAAERIITKATEGLPKGRVLTNSARLAFCKDGSVLMFGAGKAPEADLPPQLPEDKVTLDLWSWRDGFLQPMQEKRQAELRNRTSPCVWLCAEKRLVSLGGDEFASPVFLTRDGSRVIARVHEAYLQEISWDADHHDLWIINSFDGTKQRMLTHVRGNSAPSPNGRFVTYFKDRHWHALDVQSGEDKNLTAKLAVRFDNELWDQPSPPAAYGIAGWTENDESVLVQDRYDLWSLKPKTGEATCVTDGYGRAQKIDFSLVRLDPEAEFVDPKKPLLLGAEDERTRSTGLFSDSLSEVVRPQRLLMADKKLAGWRKPKKSERLFFTASTFAECQDLWTVDANLQQQMLKLTDANPQQRNIRWGKAELVSWNSGDGKPLQGVLIKPEGFDPKQKYPMMVHFYERLSQTLHNYHAPAPGTSPNPSYYVSNGYLWFQPDIVYSVGYPGDSCFKCVVPGVQSLISQGFVDPNAVAISGHSWGGYQTAYLITRTSMFKAAESGAPVVNMTSAYGGIRWSTGMSRAFQYEQTQSRIGATLWEAEMRFLENSPLFFADKVTTPLLMLHNDQDGAVPWYQGIEYFTALRRLGKEVFLFNYNGEDHGLRKRANMKDWALRMAQFFDHHLKGAPAPKWMTEGVPYVERDKEKLDFNKKAMPVNPEAQPAEASTGK